jgi:hypothetical protein
MTACRTSAGFPKKRLEGIASLPEFELLRDQAEAIREHVLEHLDWYLERFAAQVEKQGGTVHWCADAEAAREAVLGICQQAGARSVTKGKSMIGEEIAINDHLSAHGITPVETDLGEYIIQLRGETPSHIVAPALHVSRAQVTQAFREHHLDRDPERPLDAPRELLGEARDVLRERWTRRVNCSARRAMCCASASSPPTSASPFLAADVGITGANMLVAETGTSLIVTNEGNGDLTQTLPRVHVVLASIEKVVPTLEDATTLDHGPGTVGLHHLQHRSASRERPGRPRGLPRGAARQRPQRAARDASAADPALHPLRRLSRPLPRLPAGGWPRLRLGLLRADGCGTDPGAARPARGVAPAAGLDVVRALRRCLPGAHPHTGGVASLACAELGAGSTRRRLPAGTAHLGLAGHAPTRLPPGEFAGRPRAALACRRQRCGRFASRTRRLDRDTRPAGA